MEANELINVIHTALAVACPRRIRGLSLDGDGGSCELIITDDEGKQWVLSSAALRTLDDWERA